MSYHVVVDWQKLVARFRFPLVLGLIALLVIGLGLLVNFNLSSTPQVEVISVPTNQIVVDLQGAVFTPGVYELSSGARLHDLLAKAGGLTAQADRDWLTTNLNLAQKLTDGQKIYIPEKITPPKAESIVAGQRTEKSKSGKINLNTATLGELDTLAGIGPARAAQIVAGRPYGALEEVVIKAKIPASVFEKIKDLISVY